MRIAFVTIEFVTEPDLPGGLGHYLHRVSRQLVERGHEVHVITYSRQKNTQLVYDGIVVHRLPSGRFYSLLVKIFRGKFPLTCRGLDFSYNAFRLLQRAHCKRPFDILQLSNLHGSGLFSSLLLSIPYVVRVSSYAPVLNKLEQYTGTDYRLLALLENMQLRISRGLFTPSVRLKSIIQDKLRKKDISVIPSPFYREIQEFDESVYEKYLAGKSYILFFAVRLSSLKGPQVLAEALPEILSRYPDLLAVFVGIDMLYYGQSMCQYIRTMCQAYEERLIFLDPVPHAQAYPLLQHAQVVVMPSLLDNLPNSCLEAMGLGAIVIGTKGSSHEEIIVDGVNGFLSEAGNVKNLQQLIEHVLTRHDHQSMREAAILTITQKFSPEHTVTKLEHHYSQIIKHFQPEISHSVFAKLMQSYILKKVIKKILGIHSSL